MPLPLIMAAVAGDIRWAMNAVAASGSAAPRDAGLVDHFALYFGREWADHVQTGIGQHVGEEYREVGVALDDRLDHLRGPRLRFGLGFHLLTDAKTLVNAYQQGAGRAGGKSRRRPAP